MRYHTLFLLCCCATLASCTKEPVYSNPSYAVGTVESADEGFLRRSGTTYTFLVNGVRHTGKNKKTPINVKPEKGDKFMVAYEVGSIERNIMIFDDAVVNDSTDSAQYVYKYKFDPPY